MWPVFVVMAAVDAEHVLEMAAADDEDSVETLGAESADPALGVSVRVRRLDGRADHLDAFSPEDLVEGVAELCVAIVDEEPERLLVVELHEKVARLLRDPAAVRIRAAGDVLDPTGRERDEEEDVDPLQKGGSTVRKSQASMPDAWARRKPRHDECIRRCGAGRRPASSSSLRTDVADTGMPRPLSSPTIRLYPQCGFSTARRTISSRSERLSGGRPGLRCE